MPELPGCYSGIFLKDFREIALVVEMKPGGDIRQRDPGQLDQPLGLLNPLPLDIIADRNSILLLEQLREIVGIQTGHLSQFVQSKLLVHVVENIVLA